MFRHIYLYIYIYIYVWRLVTHNLKQLIRKDDTINGQSRFMGWSGEAVAKVRIAVSHDPTA